MKLMIDLETLGTSAKAHVLSIGLAFFDDEAVQSSHHMLVSPEGQESRERSYDTVMWWLKQAMENPEAAKGVLGGKREHPVRAICLLRSLIDANDVSEVWANSPTFDCAIMRDLCRDAQIEVPWKFWQERDFRTLKAVTDCALPEFDGTKHNAEADAVYQAKCAIVMLQS